jgi:sigma54-dependent transcription regulator
MRFRSCPILWDLETFVWIAGFKFGGYLVKDKEAGHSFVGSTSNRARRPCPKKATAEGSFREDLYYRLNLINIVLPPLRERSEDIVPLAEFLMKKHAPQNTAIPVITADLKHAMMSHHWPGNVRELENFVRKYSS